MTQEIALLNAKRQLIARRITAENDYATIASEYTLALAKRMYIPNDPYRCHMAMCMTRVFYAREWARSDCKGLA